MEGMELNGTWQLLLFAYIVNSSGESINVTKKDREGF
jgi:hypothetical protein